MNHTKTALGAGLLAGVAAFSAPRAACAYDSATHQRMTDYAYETMLAVAHATKGGPVDPGLNQKILEMQKATSGMSGFFGVIGAAVPKLDALPSALPTNTNPCSDPTAASVVPNPSAPNWNIGSFGTVAAAPMLRVAFPVKSDFTTNTSDCDIDIDWAPGGIFAASNPGTGTSATARFTSRDHTGSILGMWAAEPDSELDDWHLQSPYATEVDVVKDIIETDVVVASTTFITLGCIIACGLAPIACYECVQAEGGAVGDEISAFDSIPDFSDWKDPMLVGMGHHIDMKSPQPADLVSFDDHHGFFMDDPGPYHAQDSFEALVALFGDDLALHVLYDPSNGPKNYEIVLPNGGDAHPNTVRRSKNMWEAQSFPHTQFTPVDNLGMYGWQQFEALDGTSGAFPASGVAKNTSQAAAKLGFPLHAIGDATVPMHVTNTVGWGHRPYEDAMQAMLLDPSSPLLDENDPTAQVTTVATILDRAFTMRKKIVAWRNAHPGLGSDVPVRDIISNVAATTYQKAMAQAGVVFDGDASLDYVLDEDSTTTAYETAALRAVYKDLVIDGIAAEIAFLASATEVMP